MYFSFYIYNIAQAQEGNELKTFNEKPYFELGLAAGIPGGLNVLAGYWIDPVGLRISGGYLYKNTNGLQLNLAYKVSKNTKTRHMVGIAFGKSQDRGCDY